MRRLDVLKVMGGQTRPVTAMLSQTGPLLTRRAVGVDDYIKPRRSQR